MYIQYKVNVSVNQGDRLKDAIRLKKGTPLYFPTVLLLPPAQINRLDKAQVEGRRAQIRMGATQVAKNVSYTGGFLGMLASLTARAIPLAARALPTILSGLTIGLLLVVLTKRLVVVEMDSIYTNMIGNGHYLAPHPRFVEGDGLFLKHGNDISDGAGLLMVKNSPFKNIPVLGWLL